MESGKIKNEALLEAIEVFKAENNQQNLKNFIEKLLQARFILPATLDPKPVKDDQALSKSTASHVVSIVICVHFIIYLPISSFFFCDLQMRMMFLPNLLQVWSQPMLPARIHSRYASVLQSASQEPVQPVLHNDHHAE